MEQAIADVPHAGRIQAEMIERVTEDGGVWFALKSKSVTSIVMGLRQFGEGAQGVICLAERRLAIRNARDRDDAIRLQSQHPPITVEGLLPLMKAVEGIGASLENANGAADLRFQI